MLTLARTVVVSGGAAGAGSARLLPRGGRSSGDGRSWPVVHRGSAVSFRRPWPRCVAAHPGREDIRFGFIRRSISSICLRGPRIKQPNAAVAAWPRVVRQCPPRPTTPCRQGAWRNTLCLISCSPWHCPLASAKIKCHTSRLPPQIPLTSLNLTWLLVYEARQPLRRAADVKEGDQSG